MTYRMKTPKPIFKRRALAVLAVLLADVILYFVSGWVLLTKLGPAASREPFLFFAFALGIVCFPLMLAICDGRFDPQLSKVLN